MLTAPLEFLDDGKGWLRAARCQKMELGEPDSSGRRRPVPIEGSEYEILWPWQSWRLERPPIQSSKPLRPAWRLQRRAIFRRTTPRRRLRAAACLPGRYRHRRRDRDSSHGRGTARGQEHSRISGIGPVVRRERLFRGSFAFGCGGLFGIARVFDAVPATPFGAVESSVSSAQQGLNPLYPAAIRDGNSHTHGD